MASKKISELNSAASLTGSETFLIVQSGDNRKLTLDSLLGNMTTTSSVNPTLTLTTNSYIVKATGGSTANGVFKITGNATQPTITLSNSTADGKFVFNVGALNTIGGTSFSITETWNSSGLVFNTVNLTLTNSASANGSRGYKQTVGGNEVWGVDANGGVFSKDHNYTKFGVMPFVGTYNGFTQAIGYTVSTASTIAPSATDLRNGGAVFITASGGSGQVINLPVMSTQDVGKVWAFNITQSSSLDISPTGGATNAGQTYWRIRSAAAAQTYTIWYAWLDLTGTPKWYYYVPGGWYNTANTIPTTPTGTNNAGALFNFCSA